MFIVLGMYNFEKKETFLANFVDWPAALPQEFFFCTWQCSEFAELFVPLIRHQDPKLVRLWSYKILDYRNTFSNISNVQIVYVLCFGMVTKLEKGKINR